MSSDSKQGSPSLIEAEPYTPKKRAQKKNTKREGQQASERHSLEPISDVRKRAEQWPHSAEKYATLIWVDLMCLRSAEDTAEERTGSLLDNIQQLRSRLEVETFYHVPSSKIETLASQVHDSDWKEALATCVQLLKKIRPFCIHTTLYLIGESKTHSEKLRGKKAVVFLGRSGAGKSTTLLYLTGCPMNQRSNAFKDIGPEDGQAPEGFAVNGAPESETAYVRGLEVTAEYLEDVNDLDFEGKVTFLDTPGIGDNCGPEVDVANTVGIHHALTNCEQMWPVIVLSAKGSNYFKQSKDALLTASKMFKNIGSIGRNISFLFTRYQLDEHEAIAAKLGQVEEQNKELPKENAFRQLVRLAHKKVKKSEGREIVLPLDKERIKLHLADILEATKPVKRTSVAEKVALLTQSEEVIRKQLNLHGELIILGMDRGEYDLVTQRVQEVAELASCFDSELVSTHLLKAKSAVRECLQKWFSACKERLAPLKDAGTASLDLTVFQALHRIEEAVASLSSKDLDIDLSNVDCASAAAEFVQALRQGAVNPILPADQRLNQFNKLKHLCATNYPENKPLYEEAVREVIEQLEKAQSQALEEMKQAMDASCDDSLGKAGELSNRMTRLVDTLKDHFAVSEQGRLSVYGCTATESRPPQREESGDVLTPQQRFQVWLDRFTAELRRPLEALVDEATSGLNAMKPSFNKLQRDEIITKIQAAFNALSKVEDAISLLQSLGRANIYKLRDQLVAACDAHLESVSSAVARLREKDVGEALHEAKPLVQHLNVFSSLTDIAHEYHTHKAVICTNVCHCVADAQRKVRDIINNKLFGDSPDAERSRAILPSILNALKHATCFEELQPGLVDRTLNTTIQDVKDEAHHHLAVVVRMPIQIDNLDILDDVTGALARLANLRGLKGVLEGVDGQLEAAVTHVKDGVKGIREKAESWIPQIPNLARNEQGRVTEGLDVVLPLRRVQRVNLFIQDCKKHRLSNYVKCINDLHDFLEERLRQYGEYVTRCMAHLRSRISLFVDEADDDQHTAERALREVVLQLQVRLSELSKMEAKYGELFALMFDEGSESVPERLELQSDASNRDMECRNLLDQGQWKQLQIQVAAAGILQQLDDALARPKGQPTYQSVYQRYSHRLLEQTKEAGTSLKKALHNKEFRQAALMWEELRASSSNKCKTLRQDIVSAIEDVYHECQRMATVLRHSGPDDLLPNVEGLAKQLKVADSTKPLRKAVDVATKELKDDWNTSVKHVEGLVSQVFEDACEDVNRLIKRCSFREAEKRLKETETCLQLASQHLKLEGQLKKVRELHGQLEQESEGALSKLEQTSLEQAVNNPPSILMRLASESEDTQSKASKIIHGIVNRYKQHVQREDAGDVNEDEIEKLFGRFQSKVPDDLQEFVKHTKTDVLQMLERKQRCREENMGDHLDRSNFKALKAEMEKLSEQTSHSAEQMRQKLRGRIEEAKDRAIEQSLKPALGAKLLKSVRHLTQCNDSRVPGAKEALKHLTAVVDKNLKRAMKELHQQFQSPDQLSSVRIEDEARQQFALMGQYTLYLRSALCELRSSKGENLAEALSSDVAQVDTGDCVEEMQFMTQAATESLSHADESLDSMLEAVVQLNPQNVKWEHGSSFPQTFHQACCLRALSQAIQTKDLASDSSLKPLNDGCGKVWRQLQAFLQQAASALREWIRKTTALDLLDEQMNVNTEEIQKAYAQISCTKQLLTQLKVLLPYVEDTEVTKSEAELAEHLQQQGNLIHKKLEQAQESMIWEDCNRLLKHVKLLRQVDANPSQVKRHESKTEYTTSQIFKRAETFLSKLQGARQEQDVVRLLLELQSMADSLDCARDNITTRLESFLEDYNRRNDQNIPRLGIALDSKKSVVAQRVLQEYSVFKGYLRRLFNKKISSVDIDGALQALASCRVTNLASESCEKLKSKFENFEERYEEAVAKLASKKALDDIAQEVKSIVANASGDDLHDDAIEWNADVKDCIPQVCANIFAMWTIQNASGKQQARDELLQPHPSQVLAIFRLLGLDSDAESLPGGLAQVLTGQGKSVILAVTAAVLALFGLHVSVACYSQYLSDRDYKDFTFLFAKLDISKHIMYGTFQALCEAHINSQGNVRELVRHAMKKGELPKADVGLGRRLVKGAKAVYDYATRKRSVRSRRQVLLIDEVDVALQPTIFSNCYTPSAPLDAAEICDLIMYVWNHKNLSLPELKKSPEYKAVLKAFPQPTQDILHQCTKALLQDVKSFEEHDYVFEDGKIGYKLHDSVSFTMRMGYKTVFALLHELEKQSRDVTSPDVQEQLCFLINCGEFSYFAIQKEFDVTLGVTGTLAELSRPEQRVLTKDYEIRTMTVMPSMFGASQLKSFEAQDLALVDSEHFYLTISQEIKKRHVAKRPVLVVFDTPTTLHEFRTHHSFRGFGDHVQVLTETLPPSEKQKIVRNATLQRKITLCTRSFGRGVDFQVRDPEIPQKGGMHVLQTFLAETMAEERQIMGRTARQGEPGSYSMVLCRERLETVEADFNTLDSFESAVDKLQYLHQLRDDAFVKSFSQHHKTASSLKKKHKSSMKFLEQLRGRQVEYVFSQLLRWNRTSSQLGSTVRTLYALDCTCSMSMSLAKTTQVIGTVFDRISKVLEDNGLEDSSNFAIQLVAFRNYNTPVDQLLQASPWENNPLRLRQFLSGLRVNGGWGNEAIEVALHRANLEDVSQVILIGDAPANTSQEVTQKRQSKGEAYWQTHSEYARATTADAELAELSRKHIPVHSFYIKPRAKEFFRKAAHQTGGRCEFLDIESESGADQLTHLVSEELLRKLGGSNLVEDYRATFCC